MGFLLSLLANPQVMGLAGEAAGAVLGGKKKRHRRKRMLTASDKADIAFLKGILGAKEAATVASARMRG